MILLLMWLGLAVAIGALASNKGRNFFGWFLLSVLLSPLIGGVLLAAAGSRHQKGTSGAPQTAWSCPFCAEPIQVAAKICPHCRSALPSIDPQVFKDYPEVYGNFHYRSERDGSILLATPSGPRRFKNWSEFWRAVN